MMPTNLNAAATKRIAICLALGLFIGVGTAQRYLASTPEEYRSESTFILAPDSLASSSSRSNALGSALSLLGGSDETSDMDIYLGRLRSRDFMDKFLQDHAKRASAFRPFLSDEDYQLVRSERREVLPPYLLDRFRNDFFRITPSSSQRIFKLAVTSGDAEQSRYLANAFLDEANRSITRSALAESSSRLGYLRQQLMSAQNVELRNAISVLAAEEIRKSTLISGSSAFGIARIDAPTLSEDPVWPSKLIVSAIGVINGIVLGAMLYFSMRRLWR